jgi:lysophospholipase L1-like esterase
VGIVVDVTDYVNFSATPGYNNSAAINKAIWDAYVQTEAGGGGHDSGTVLLPGGIIECWDNIHPLPWVDIKGMGFNTTRLSLLRGARFVINSSDGTKLNDNLSSRGEPIVVGTLRNPNLVTSLEGVNSYTQGNFYDFTITRDASRPSDTPLAGSAVLVWSGTGSGWTALNSNLTMKNFGILYNWDATDPTSNLICHGLEIFGGSSVKTFGAWITQCNGVGLRIKLAGNSFDGVTDFDFYGLEVNNCWQAAELLHADRMQFNGCGFEDNGRGMTIDGLVKGFSLNHSSFVNNIATTRGDIRNKARTLLTSSYTDADPELDKYDICIGYRSRNGVATDLNNITSTVYCPKQLDIHSTRFVGSTNPIVVFKAGESNPALEGWSLPGNGGLSVRGINTSATRGYVISSRVVENYELVGFWENINNNPTSGLGFTAASICNRPTVEFNERMLVLPELTSGDPGNIDNSPGVLNITGTYSNQENSTINILVHRGQGSYGAASVGYEVTGGLSNPASGTISWPAGIGGIATASVQCSPVEFDTIGELRILNPSEGVTISNSSVPFTVTAIVAGNPGTINITGVYSNLEGSIIQLQATRSVDIIGEVSVSWNVSDSLCSPSSGVFTWPNGVGGNQFAQVTCNNNVVGDQIGTFTISNPSPGLTINTNSVPFEVTDTVVGSGGIINIAGTYSNNMGSSISVGATRSVGNVGEASVRWTISNNLGSPNTGRITWPASSGGTRYYNNIVLATVGVTTNGTLTIDDPVNCSLGATSQVAFTVVYVPPITLDTINLVGNYTYDEGQTIAIVANRSGNGVGAASVNYSITDGLTSPNNGLITWGNGSLGDGYAYVNTLDVMGNQSGNITISSANNCIINTSVRPITIVDTDEPAKPLMVFGDSWGMNYGETTPCIRRSLQLKGIYYSHLLPYTLGAGNPWPALPGRGLCTGANPLSTQLPTILSLAAALTNPPDVGTFIIGANDLTDTTEATFKTQYALAHSRFAAAGIRVVCWGPQGGSYPGALFSAKQLRTWKALRPWVRDYCKVNGIDWVSPDFLFVGGDEANAVYNSTYWLSPTDGLHLNDTGYGLLVDLINEKLIQAPPAPVTDFIGYATITVGDGLTHPFVINEDTNFNISMERELGTTGTLQVWVSFNNGVSSTSFDTFSWGPGVSGVITKTYRSSVVGVGGLTGSISFIPSTGGTVSQSTIVMTVNDVGVVIDSGEINIVGTYSNNEGNQVTLTAERTSGSDLAASVNWGISNNLTDTTSGQFNWGAGQAGTRTQVVTNLPVGLGGNSGRFTITTAVNAALGATNDVLYTVNNINTPGTISYTTNPTDLSTLDIGEQFTVTFTRTGGVDGVAALAMNATGTLITPNGIQPQVVWNNGESTPIVRTFTASSAGSNAIYFVAGTNNTANITAPNLSYTVLSTPVDAGYVMLAAAELEADAGATLEVSAYRFGSHTGAASVAWTIPGNLTNPATGVFNWADGLGGKNSDTVTVNTISGSTNLKTSIVLSSPSSGLTISNKPNKASKDIILNKVAGATDSINIIGVYSAVPQGRRVRISAKRRGNLSSTATCTYSVPNTSAEPVLPEEGGTNANFTWAVNQSVAHVYVRTNTVTNSTFSLVTATGGTIGGVSSVPFNVINSGILSLSVSSTNFNENATVTLSVSRTNGSVGKASCLWTFQNMMPSIGTFEWADGDSATKSIVLTAHKVYQEYSPLRTWAYMHDVVGAGINIDTVSCYINWVNTTKPTTKIPIYDASSQPSHQWNNISALGTVIAPPRVTILMTWMYDDAGNKQQSMDVTQSYNPDGIATGINNKTWLQMRAQEWQAAGLTHVTIDNEESANNPTAALHTRKWAYAADDEDIVRECARMFARAIKHIKDAGYTGAIGIYGAADIGFLGDWYTNPNMNFDSPEWGAFHVRGRVKWWKRAALQLEWMREAYLAADFISPSVYNDNAAAWEDRSAGTWRRATPQEQGDLRAIYKDASFTDAGYRKPAYWTYTWEDNLRWMDMCYINMYQEILSNFGTTKPIVWYLTAMTDNRIFTDYAYNTLYDQLKALEKFPNSTANLWNNSSYLPVWRDKELKQVSIYNQTNGSGYIDFSSDRGWKHLTPNETFTITARRRGGSVGIAHVGYWFVRSQFLATGSTTSGWLTWTDGDSQDKTIILQAGASYEETDLSLVIGSNNQGAVLTRNTIKCSMFASMSRGTFNIVGTYSNPENSSVNIVVERVGGSDGTAVMGWQTTGGVTTTTSGSLTWNHRQTGTQFVTVTTSNVTSGQLTGALLITSFTSGATTGTSNVTFIVTNT